MTATLQTPFGPISLCDDGTQITALVWQPGQGPATPLQRDGLCQLAEYFAGTRQIFDLPLDWGAGLQHRVRRAMAAIPFGETRTYGDIAKDVGAPAQAVGQACGANPLPLLIPCHRILGAKTLGGFSAPGGVETKLALLRHENAAGLLI